MSLRLALVAVLACVLPATAALGCAARATRAAEGACMGERPVIRGKSFDTLDAYLAELKHLGTMDIPYYEEIEPGVYQRIAGRATQTRPPELYTRAELLEKYCFTE